MIVMKTFNVTNMIDSAGEGVEEGSEGWREMEGVEKEKEVEGERKGGREGVEE